MSTALVLAGGTIPDFGLLTGAAKADFIIAADGGVRIARTHGLPIHLVVGDLDSASASDIAWARAEQAEIVEYAQDKDYTDLELALDRAEETGVDRIVAIGIVGGRLDHELGNWAALCAPRNARVDVYSAQGTASVLHGEGHNTLELEGVPGDVVSLIARSDAAAGVTTSGLKWPLSNAVLSSWSTRGISNELISTKASVTLTSGVLMIVRPGICSFDV